MGFYADTVLPRITDLALRGAPIEDLRARATTGLTGEVLEIGFGSGRNVPHLPDDVTRLLAVEPAAAGRRMAAGRIAERGVPVEHIGLDGAALDLPDRSVDHALSTWTLCTIPDVASALGEIRRVVRPGGTLHFVEHGRAPEPGVRRWQDRLTPLQERVFGGCHLNRPIDDLIRAAGLDLTDLQTFYVRGPKVMSYFYVGVATAASGS